MTSRHDRSSVFFVLFVSVFATMFGVGIVIPFLPIYAKSMGATGLWLGLIFAGFSVSRSIFMPIVGRLSDLRGRKIFISFGLFFYAVLSLGYVFARNPLELTLVRLAQGFSSAMVLPIAMAYVGEMSKPENLGRNMGYFNRALFLGFAFGPLTGGLVGDYFGIKTSFYLMSALCFFAFLFATILLPELNIYKENKDRVSLRKALRSNRVRALISFRISNSFGRGVYACFLPIFAGVHLGLSYVQIGVLIAVGGVIASVLQPSFGRLADRYSREKMIVIGNLVDPVGLILTTFMANFYQLLILYLIMGVGRAFCIAASSAFAASEGSKFGMGSLMGIFSMAMSIGMAIGPIMGGQVMDFAGINYVFYFASAMEFLGTALFFLFWRYSDRDSPGKISPETRQRRNL